MIDVCSLKHDIALLQQACDITEGIFFKVPNLSALLQYLLVNFVIFCSKCFRAVQLTNYSFSLKWIFLPDPNIRKKLVVPPPNKVDYRPLCFCHRELIDIGYVCSVCLSSMYGLIESLHFMCLSVCSYLIFLKFSSFSFLQIHSYLYNMRVSLNSCDSKFFLVISFRSNNAFFSGLCSKFQHHYRSNWREKKSKNNVNFSFFEIAEINVRMGLSASLP